jgi:hypothetical protein
MKALSYLLRRTIRNALLQMLKKPLLVILGAFFVVMMGIMLLTSGEQRQSYSGGQDILRAAAWVILGFVAYSTISKGLKQGSTFFAMPDVNMVFTSPIRPQLVLLYGVIRQMGVSLMATLFMCFQIPNMRNFLHLNGVGIFAVISGWFLMLLVSQILALCIYSLTAPYPFRRKVGNILLYGYFGLVGVGLIIYLLVNGGNIQSIPAFFALPVVDFFPVIGWINAYIFGLMNGETGWAILFLLLAVLFPVLCIALVRRSNSDYYEDVLQTTELRFSMRQAWKEGKVSAKNVSLPARTGKSGIIGRGQGASVFFYRQLTEQRRTRRFYLEISSYIVIAIGLAAGIVLRNLSRQSGTSPELIQIYAFAVLCYVLYFVTMSGKFTQELSKPFLYLVPASDVMKLMYANLATVIKSFIEGLIAFSIISFLAGLPVWYAILAAVLYASMSQLFISISILTQRLQGGTSSKIIGTFLYILCTGLLLFPGLAVFGGLHAIMYFTGQDSFYLAYIATIIYNLAASAITLIVGKGILREANT